EFTMNLVARHPGTAEPPLLPPREAPYVLSDVLEKMVHGCRDELILNLGDCFLRFGVEIDTDTIVSQFQVSPFLATIGYASLKAAEPWNKYGGKECGWTWFGWNQQGYLDTVLISFNGIEPGVLLQTIASSIKVYVVSPAAKTSPSGAADGEKAKTKRKR